VPIPLIVLVVVTDIIIVITAPGGRALDDLVKFAAVQPHAAAFRAMVDLYALPLCDPEFSAAHRAVH
jgi:hypothetical protein